MTVERGGLDGKSIDNFGRGDSFCQPQVALSVNGVAPHAGIRGPLSGIRIRNFELRHLIPENGSENDRRQFLFQVVLLRVVPE